MNSHAIATRILKWGRLPEHLMLRARLQDYLGIVSATTAIEFLEFLLVATRRRESEAVRTYIAFIDLVENQPEITARLDEWQQAAVALGTREVEYVLDVPNLQLEIDQSERPLFHPDLQELTLGERKSKARLAKDRDLDKYVNENDPQVLDILFRHPGMTDKRVVRMLAKRPQVETVFSSVFRVPKWMSSGDVHRASVFNPYTPPRLSLKLLPLLASDECRQVRNDQVLDPTLRQYATQLSVLIDYAGSFVSTDSGVL